MADPQTTDLGLNVPSHGSDVGTWDTSLNYNFNVLDSRLNGTLTMFSTTTPGGFFLTGAQTQNARFTVNGALGAAFTITFASSVLGGSYVIDNETTGGFSVIATAPSSLAGRSATIPQGGRSVVTSDGVNVDLGNDVLPSALSQAAVEFIVDGGGAAVSTGNKGFLELPFNFKVSQWTLIGDISGTAAMDVWTTTYGAVTGITSANSIVGSSQPALAAGQTAQSATLTGWTTTLPIGNMLAFVVSSVSGTVPTRLTLSLRGTKS